MVSPSEPKNCAKIIHNNENTQAAKGGRTCLWGLRARCCQTYIFLKLDLKFVGGTNAVIERHLTTATQPTEQPVLPLGQSVTKSKRRSFPVLREKE
jgi:hypothetical protein